MPRGAEAGVCACAWACPRGARRRQEEFHRDPGDGLPPRTPPRPAPSPPPCACPGPLKPCRLLPPPPRTEGGDSSGSRPRTFRSGTAPPLGRAVEVPPPPPPPPSPRPRWPNRSSLPPRPRSRARPTRRSCSAKRRRRRRRRDGRYEHPGRRRLPCRRGRARRAPAARRPPMGPARATVDVDGLSVADLRAALGERGLETSVRPRAPAAAPRPLDGPPVADSAGSRREAGRRAAAVRLDSGSDGDGGTRTRQLRRLRTEAAGQAVRGGRRAGRRRRRRRRRPAEQRRPAGPQCSPTFRTRESTAPSTSTAPPTFARSASAWSATCRPRSARSGATAPAATTAPSSPTRLAPEAERAGPDGQGGQGGRFAQRGRHQGAGRRGAPRWKSCSMRCRRSTRTSARRPSPWWCPTDSGRTSASRSLLCSG